MLPNQTFQLQADIYTLIVTSNENKLTLELHDFVDWIIYKGDFNKDNIGNELTLSEIFQSFTSYSADKRKLTKNRWPVLQHYQYGTILKTIFNCYKIQQEGKITVYSTTIQSNKKITHQKLLTLQKIRQLNSDQIQTIRTNRRYKINVGEFSDVILNQLTQISTLQKNYNTQISVQAQLEMLLDEKKEEIDQYMQNKLAQHAEESNFKIQSYLNTVIFSTSGSLKTQAQKEYLSKAEQILQENKKKIFESRHTLKQILYSERYLTLHQQNFGRFRIFSKLRVVYNGPDEVSTMFIFNSPIFPKRNSKFRIKILKLGNFQAKIGLLDYNKSKQQRNFNVKSESEGMAYSALFSSRGIVQFKVDRKNNRLTIFVDSVKKIEEKTPEEKFEHVPYYPFIELCQPGDMVQWLPM